MMRPTPILSIIFISISAFFILLHPCRTYGQEVKEPIKIGIASMITPVEAIRYYQDIADYIGKKLGMSVQIIYRMTYTEMDRLLERDKVQVAFICSAPYVNDHDKFGVELLAAPIVNGRSLYNSYIIVHKDSHIKSFADLKRKTFAFTDPMSNSGWLYAAYRLSKMHYTPQTFFKKYTYSYSHNKSIEMVAKRQVDGASVDSLVYDYMLKKHSPYVALTRIIEKSPPFGTPPVVVIRNMDQGIKKKIKDTLLDMHKDPKGRAILGAMMIDRFSTANDRDYDSIRMMERWVNKGAKIGVIPRERNVIYFSVIPRDNPRIAYEKYQPLIDYLSEATPYRFELVLRKSYEDTVTDMGNGTIDIALLGPLTYLEAHKKYGAVCMLKPNTADGGAYYRSVIITRKDSSIRSLSDLKGKSFAFASVKSTSGNLIPRYLLANSGIHLGNLKTYTNFDYDESVVKAVLSGQYDAGAVKDTVAEKYYSLGLKIIEESGPIPAGPLVIGPKTPPAVTEAVKRALYDLKPSDKNNQELLKKLDIDLRYGFVKARDNDYAGIRRMINSIPRTCGMGCHPKIRL